MILFQHNISSKAKQILVVFSQNCKPDITIIIPMLNAGKDITRCLDSISKLKGDFSLEVIIVDNGSTDDSVERATAFEWIQLLSHKIKGAAHARNMGWRAARADVIAFTDSDCCVHPSWLLELFPELQKNENLSAVGGAVLAGSSKSPVAAYIDERQLLSSDAMFIDDFFSPPFLITCNAIYRKSALEKVSGFRPLWPCEDADLSWRCLQNKMPQKHLPNRAIVYHYHRETVGSLFKMMENYGYGGAEIFYLHREWIGRDHWIEFSNYLNVIFSIMKIILSPMPSKASRRRTAFLDFIRSVALIKGRWRASLKYKSLIL